MTKRRTFLALGASALAAGAVGSPLVAGAQLIPPCTPPMPAGAKVTPFSTRYRQRVIARVSAFDASYDWTRLTNAYAKMRALPSSDPRSLAAQQNVHAWFCQQCAGEPPPADIHGRWTFFVWHRAFLYFHERILGQLVGDTTLRLPYWDWEKSGHQTLPSQYYQGALNDSTRELQPGQNVQRHLPCCGGWYYDLINDVPQEIALNFTGIGGDATTAGDVEVNPHGYVHMSVGGANGDMGNLELAAGDPIFFAHHANVDRLWYSWEHYGSNVDPAGLSSIPAFTFYDGSAWRSIKATQMIPTTKLGYTYDTKVAPPLRFTHYFPIELLPAQIVKGPPPETVRALAASPEVAVSLSRIQYTGAGAFTVSVKNAGKATVVGTFFVVPHGKHAMNMTRAANVHFIVTPAVAKLLAQPGAQLTVARAVVGRQFTALPPAPAKFEGLTLSTR